VAAPIPEAASWETLVSVLPPGEVALTISSFRPDFSGRRLFPTDEKRKGYQQIHPSVLVRKQLVRGYEPAAVLPPNWQKLVSNKYDTGH